MESDTWTALPTEHLCSFYNYKQGPKYAISNLSPPLVEDPIAIYSYRAETLEEDFSEISSNEKGSSCLFVWPRICPQP